MSITKTPIMKKNLILTMSILLFVGVACKKERTCECTTTSSSSFTDANGVTNTTTNEPQKTTVVYKDVKKSDLETTCGDSKYDSKNSNGQTTNTYVSETKCEIK